MGSSTNLFIVINFIFIIATKKLKVSPQDNVYILFHK